jgi:hypothetical protein
VGVDGVKRQLVCFFNNAIRQPITLKTIKMAVIKTTNMPPIKNKSAIRSKGLPLFILPRIERNERIQLSIKKKIATISVLSIIVRCDNFKNLRDVSTTKHNPNKLEDAFNICGAFWFFS